MSFITAYLQGLQKTFNNKIIWALLYGFNFLFAIIVSFPLFRFLDSKLGMTKATDRLADHFDFTIVNDILGEYGESINRLLDQSVMVSFLYLIFSVFLVGGILQILKTEIEAKKLQNFWSGCAKYFWRMLRLTIYFLIIHLTVFFIFFTIFNILTAGGVERFDSERQIWNIGYAVFGVYFFVATIFFMIQDYAKIHIVHEDKKWIFQPIFQAFRFVFKNFGKTLLLYFLNLLTFGILLFIFWNVHFSNNLLAFLFGQIFIIARIGTKLLNLGSAMAFFINRTNM